MLKRIVTTVIKSLYRMSMAGASKGMHVTRYYFYRHISDNFRSTRAPDLKVLTISHSENLARALGFADEQIFDAAYPQFNILNLPFEDSQFDAVVSDQVLEHVEGNPQAAIDEAFRVLKPDGLALHTTCFINPIHGAPKDFWRFTPDALKLLVSDHANVVDAGGWGNIFVWIFFALGLRYERIPNWRLHPAHWIAVYNQPRLPITTWVLAKKKSNGTN